MTSEIDEFRASLVAAVQAELERHASAVVAEVDRLREEGQRERAVLRTELNDQLRSIAQVIEQSQARSDTQIEKSRVALDQRISRVRVAPDAPARRPHQRPRRPGAGRGPSGDAADA